MSALLRRSGQLANASRFSLSATARRGAISVHRISTRLQSRTESQFSVATTLPSPLLTIPLGIRHLHSQNRKSDESNNKLPEGWSYLTLEDIALIKKHLGDRLGPMLLQDVGKHLEKGGTQPVPTDLKDALKMLEKEGPSFSILNKMTRAMMSMSRADIPGATFNNTNFNQSTPPGTSAETEPLKTKATPQKPAEQQDDQSATETSRQEGQPQEKQEEPMATQKEKNEKQDELEPEMTQKEKNEKQREQELHAFRDQAKKDWEKMFGPQESQPSGGNKDGKGRKSTDNNKKPDEKSGFKGIGMFEIVLAITAYIILGPLMEALFFGNTVDLTWEEARRRFLDKGLITRFTVERDRVYITLKEDAAGSVEVRPGARYSFSIGSTDSFEKKLEAAQDELRIPSSQRIPVNYSQGSGMMQLFMAFGPTLLIIGLIYWTSRSMGGGRGGPNGIFSMGKTKAKIYSDDSIKTKFADVAGMEEAKMEIMEFVSFLKQPDKFERLGAKIPRGAILSGPPGTGKTLLAKATAGESGVPFFSVSGSEFVEMFVGVGASRVRDLFASARKNAPCIIFIDEIDAIGRSRQSGSRFGGNDEREATLNQILTEMDGFNTTEQVVVLAGTNRADVLDKALMRPGRFDRHIYIDRPTMKGRQEIFRVHLKKIVTKEDVDHLVGRLSSLTPGFSGADIANVVNEAALVAARANAESVTVTHFEQAIERVIAGLERKSLVLKPDEKKTVAYHEAGHAICGWYLKYADPLLKVSIIPRGQGALGYAQYLPSGDTYLMNINQLMDRMAMTLGGRVSEELHFPTVTTGASDDFKKVTEMARRMVTEWGMSEKIGTIHYNNDPNAINKPFAEGTAQEIDREVQRIVKQAYDLCKDLLTKHKKEVGLVAEELLKKEMLVRDDMVRILGRRPWGNDEEFEKYFGAVGPSSAPPPPEETTPGGTAPALMEGNSSQSPSSRS